MDKWVVDSLIFVMNLVNIKADQIFLKLLWFLCLSQTLNSGLTGILKRKKNSSYLKDRSS